MSLGEDEGRALVAQLRAAAATRRPAPLPAGFTARCPLDVALQLQQWHVDSVLASCGGTVIGTKLGGATESALQALRLDAPFTGPIFSARTFPSPARLARSDFVVGIVEAEIGLRLAADLDSVEPLSPEELADRTAAVFPCLELADARWANWAQADAAAIVADLGFAGAWVRGEEVDGWRAIDLRSVTVTLRRDGEVVREGSGALVLGYPWRALSLSAAALARAGRPLRAGAVVSTGTCTDPVVSPEPGLFEANFGPLGTVSLTLY